MARKTNHTGCDKYLVACNGDSSSDDICGDCLDLRRVFIPTSPKILVWSAFEEANKKEKKITESEKGFIWLLIIGSFFSTVGILTLIWKPFDILLNERLKMTKGLPAYDWWQTPPDEVLLRAYVFNYTNTEEFLNGKTDKLHVEEVGPYIFREKLYHENVTINDNGTLSYTAIRKAIYLPEMNHLSLDSKVIVPNLAVMGAASYLSNAPFITRIGFKMLMNRMKSKAFVETSVDKYFWNLTDPLLSVAQSLAPSMVPTNNVGILQLIYKHFEDRVTVLIGTKNGPRSFFKIDKYNGASGMQAYENETCDSVQGASEGVSYQQNIYRNDTIKYLRKTICRAVPLYHTRDVDVDGMLAYKFELLNNTFARPSDGSEECFTDGSYPILPTGLTDVSPCYFNFPIATSFPHFMYTDPSVADKIVGLKPSWEKHGSAAIIEPNTGVPFTAWARSQSSLVMHSMSGFPALKKFENMAIPMFWLEYKQMGLPIYIKYLLYFTVVILPKGQIIGSISSILIGFLCYILGLYRFINRSKQNYSSVEQVFLPKEMRL